MAPTLGSGSVSTSHDSSIFAIFQIKHHSRLLLYGRSQISHVETEGNQPSANFTLFFVRLIPLAFSISASFSAFFLSNSECLTFSSCAFRNNLTKFNRVAVTAVTGQTYKCNQIWHYRMIKQMNIILKTRLTRVYSNFSLHLPSWCLSLSIFFFPFFPQPSLHSSIVLIESVSQES